MRTQEGQSSLNTWAKRQSLCLPSIFTTRLSRTLDTNSAKNNKHNKKLKLLLHLIIIYQLHHFRAILKRFPALHLNTTPTETIVQPTGIHKLYLEYLAWTRISFVLVADIKGSATNESNTRASFNFLLRWITEWITKWIGLPHLILK